jgi:hypothetical protein
MVACVLTGNISGEATTPLGNILREAMRHARRLKTPRELLDHESARDAPLAPRRTPLTETGAPPDNVCMGL